MSSSSSRIGPKLKFNKKINTHNEGRKIKDSRCSTEGTLVRVRANGRERIGDHRDEQIDEPEVEHKDRNNEEETRGKVLRVDDAIHQRGPLKSLLC